MAKSQTKYSKSAIKWLNFLQNYPPFKTEDTFNLIHHALNTKEKEIKTPTLRFHCDGYCIINGVEHFMFFHGCFFHQCSNCQSGNKSPFITPQKIEEDKKVEAYCRAKGVYHVMFECQWIKLEKSGISYQNFTSQFYDQKDVEETQLLDAIKDGTLYGFIQADIKSPQAVIEKFKSVNFPPIFNHVHVEEDMVNPDILKKLKDKKVDFTKQKQLTLTFTATDYLMTTDLCQWYMDQGLIVENVGFVVEYIKHQPFKNFITKLTECRKEADANGQSDLAALFKLKANSTYGSLALDRSKVRIIISEIY